MYRIMRKINLISRCQGNYLAEKMKQTGVYHGHHGYVLTIARNPGISQEALSAAMCVNKSNVARAVAQLEELGFVERRPADRDKRVLQLYPTEKLQLVLPQIRNDTQAWNTYLTEGLREEDMQQFHRILDHIVERAIAYAEKGAAVSE